MNWPLLASHVTNPVCKPEHSSPAISVVIPSAGAPDVFEECLSSLVNGDYAPHEIILVDDAMDSAAHEIARRYSVRIIENRGKGVSAARNAGAKSATGEIIVFTDTDVIFPADGINRIASLMTHEMDADGCIGIQSGRLRFSNFASRYKNHWMRFTYLRLSNPVHLFYTSCAAIRRSIFLKTPGFDELYRLPSVEDTAFGDELGRIGASIHIVSDLQIEHVKHYTCFKVLRTDFYRSSALIRYVLRNMLKQRSNCIRKTSVPKRFMLACALMGCTWLSIVSAMKNGPAGLIIGALCLTILLILNMAWLMHLKKEENWLFVIRSIAFLPVDLTVVIAGMISGAAGFLAGKRY